jgi:hypothetical protein
MAQWYYSKNGTQLGPVEEAVLRAKIASGEISAADLVWREGMSDWLTCGKVAELASHLGQAAVAPVGPGPGGAAGSPYAPSSFPGGVGVPPVSGLAVASLVCGIVGLVTCMFLVGIPAVVCGHMALNRISTPGIQLGGRGMAIAGLVMGYISIALGIGALLLFALGAFANAVH